MQLNQVLEILGKPENNFDKLQLIQTQPFKLRIESKFVFSVPQNLILLSQITTNQLDGGIRLLSVPSGPCANISPLKWQRLPGAVDFIRRFMRCQYFLGRRFEFQSTNLDFYINILVFNGCL